MLSVFQKARINYWKPLLLCTNSVSPIRENNRFSRSFSTHEENTTLHRTRWREEIRPPLYAESYVRRRCKEVPFNKRETTWKNYLAAMRSRDAEKNFLDWGCESVASNDKMKPIVYDEMTTLAHAEFRLAKDFGIMTRILSDIHSDSFRPTRFLDVGCGTGSSTLSCLEMFPSIADCSIIDGSEYMLDFTQALINESTKPSLSLTSYTSLLSLLDNKEKGYDLISMHRFLSDLPSNKARASAVVIAWEMLQPGGILVVAEEGSRWGFHLTRCARSLVLRMNTTSASILAPCMHSQECPLKGNKKCWCHFAQQCAPGPTAPYKSRRKNAEVYSYCVLQKSQREEKTQGRILSTPLKRDQHVLIDLCCPSGSFERRVYSKGKMKEQSEEYRIIRKAEWGGVLSL